MHVIFFLTALLLEFGRSQDLEERQYDQYTIWTSTPSVYYSYYSTTIITCTTWVPCPVVFTSYTTETRTACPSNCPCTDCNPQPQPCPGCGGGGGGLTCGAKSCTPQPGYAVQSTTYQFGEQAPVLANGAYVTSTPAQYCSVFVENPNYPISAPALCGGIIPGPVITDPVSPSPIITDGVSVVTYTYQTNGAIIVVATTLQNGNGPFTLDTSGVGNRLGGGNPYVFFCIWTAAAAIAAVGMLVL